MHKLWKIINRTTRWHEQIVVEAPYSNIDVLQAQTLGSTLARPFPWTLRLSPYAWRSLQLLTPETNCIMLKTQILAWIKRQDKSHHTKTTLLSNNVANEIIWILICQHLKTSKKKKRTCPTISWLERFLENPPFPVAQNEQRNGQPTWIPKG